jgi:hypothetical protein
MIRSVTTQFNMANPPNCVSSALTETVSGSVPCRQCIRRPKVPMFALFAASSNQDLVSPFATSRCFIRRFCVAKGLSAAPRVGRANVGNAVAVWLPSIEAHKIPAIYQISTSAKRTPGPRRVATVVSASDVANAQERRRSSTDCVVDSAHARRPTASRRE